VTTKGGEIVRVDETPEEREQRRKAAAATYGQLFTLTRGQKKTLSQA
jgi:hypothetical protein